LGHSVTPIASRGKPHPEHSLIVDSLLMVA